MKSSREPHAGPGLHTLVNDTTEPTAARLWHGLHPDVLKLGLVSFLTDLSSEMIFAVFAVFFTSVAGASSALLGLVEGLADFSSSALNYLAGWLSDRNGRRKAFVIAGYGFSTLAKAVLLVSTVITSLAVFRVIERLGKGFRGPPRDAWLATVAAKETRGYAFGVHKALDKAGAVLGPLLAYALLAWLGENAAGYRALFWVAFVPALLSLVVLARIPDQPGERFEREPIGASWRALSGDFKRFLVPAAVFSLAYFSLGFLLLRAHEVGFDVAQVVLLYALFNTTCVIAAPLVGRLGDRIGRTRIVLAGYALYGLVNLGMVFADAHGAIVALFALYGVFFAIDESQGKAFIADLEPHRRATAIGVYEFATGLVYVPASLLAGLLWLVSPAAVFALATGLSVLAMLLLVRLQPIRA